MLSSDSEGMLKGFVTRKPVIPEDQLKPLAEEWTERLSELFDITINIPYYKELTITLDFKNVPYKSKFVINHDVFNKIHDINNLRTDMIAMGRNVSFSTIIYIRNLNNQFRYRRTKISDSKFYFRKFIFITGKTFTDEFCIWSTGYFV